jgi:uncharacterized repeat protein (TIGR01451 family)
MTTILSKLQFKVGTSLAVAMFFGAVLIIGGAPTASNHSQAESCEPVYTNPIFNPYPVKRNGDGSFVNSAGSDCTDYPVLSGGVTTGTSYWDNFSANVGDTIQLRVYVHNGAATGSDAKMQNAAYSVSLDTNPGTQHTVTARLTASNAQEKDGSIVINTPAGASLQLVDGSLSGSVTSPGEPTGTQDACFEYTKQFIITIKVVGQQQAEPAGDIQASVTGQCPFINTVTWTSSNASAVGVFEKNPDSGVDQLISSSPNGTLNRNSLQSGKHYVYSLWTVDGTTQVKLLSVRGFDVPNIDCQPQPPAQSASIQANLGTSDTSACLYNGTVTWQSSGYSDVGMFVKDPGTGQYKIVAGATNGSNTVTWLSPNKTYEFTLWTVNTSSGNYDRVAKIAGPAVINVPNLNCGTTPPPTYNFDLSITPNPVCVGSSSTYTIFNATSDLDGKQIYWSSTIDKGQGAHSTGEVLSGYTGQIVNSNGSWSGVGTPAWDSSEIGSWVKTASFVDSSGKIIASKSQSFVVKDCSTSSQTYTATATASASASATASCADGTSATATATASASATATSHVSQQDAQNQAQSQAQSQAQASANAQANASASAKCPNTPPACVANGNFALNASTPVKNNSGYSVTLIWTSTGNHQIKITQLNPGASYENTVTVGSSSGSQTINGLLAGSTYVFKMYDVSCDKFLTSVSVTTASNPGQLTCSVGSSTINSGSAANFTAQGGTAPYNWSGDGSPASGTGSVYNPVYTNTTTSSVNHNVSVTSSDGQTANCSVVVNGQQQNNGNNNYNCVNNSCNHTTNNTDNSINDSYNTTNSVNDSYNTTNTYNNTVYISSNGNVVPANQFSQLSITKSVRDVYNNYNNGSFSNSVSANNGDTVQFQIVVSNSGSATANNVRVTDSLPSGLNLVSGSVSVNGSNATSNNLYNGMYLGSLSSGQSETITFSATVLGNGSSSIQNTATASSDNAGSVQASAWVFVNGNGNVLGGNVNITYSKSAFNNTKNQNATAVSASREDYITYTLTASNSGNTPATNFVITDDLSQVLPYADISDNGGGNLNGNVITYPGITVPANGSVTRSFEVRVKYSLSGSLSYVMTNTYGNTVTIRINTPQVLGAYTAPKTGADTNAFVFAGLLTAGFAIYKKKSVLMKLIFN